MSDYVITCLNCKGTGFLELHAMGPEKCNICKGKGVIQVISNNLITNLENALIEDLYKQIAAANLQIEALKCCGNCRFAGRGRCSYVGEKCERWEEQ